MCHHFIGFQSYDRLPKPRVMWRCSACGRESQVPIDCCVQPAYAAIPQSGIGHVVCQWLRAMITQAVTGLATIRQRRRSSVADICATDSLSVHINIENIEITDPLLPETDTEIAELEETTHAPV
jgi:hypothetical protein